MSDGDDTPEDESTSEARRTGSRDVVVPLRLYKTVAVFSTLAAIVLVVVGFTFLDAAAIEGSVLFTLIDALPVAVASPVSDSLLSAVLAATGLASIAAGALVYAFATRFRAAGMGKGKDEEAEDTDNG